MAAQTWLICLFVSGLTPFAFATMPPGGRHHERRAIPRFPQRRSDRPRHATATPTVEIAALEHKSFNLGHMNSFPAVRGSESEQQYLSCSAA